MSRDRNIASRKAARTLRSWLSRHAPISATATLCGVLACAAASAEEKEKPEEFSMVVGEELAFNGVREFAIENQQVLTANVAGDKKSVLVRALRPGVSRILLRAASDADKSRSLEIVVSLRDPKAVVTELEDLLRPYPGLKVRVNKARVLIEGNLKAAEELTRLRDIERRFDGQVVLLATVAMTEAPRPIMIRLDLHHVSVKRRFSHRLGVRYPASVSGGQVLSMYNSAATLGSSWISQTSVLGDLLPSLDFNEANGYIKLKRTDTLITENGAKAVYREGAELYVRLSGTLGAGQLEKVFFGADLTVTPHLSPNNDAVTLELSADITQRDSAATQDGIPGRSLSQVRTVVHIPVGQSVMLAGVDLQSAGQTRTGLPWLSRIPVLGYLFGSNSAEAESAYGVVFITPTILQESSAAVQQQIDRAMRAFEKPQRVPLLREHP